MAIFNIASVDGKLSGQFKGSSAREAAMSAFSVWGSELQSKIEVTRKAPKPTKANKSYKCDCCGCEIKKGDGYFRVTRRIGNPKNDTIIGMAIVQNSFSYTAPVCIDCK
mgnify:CR=1 FL=1